MKKNAQVSKLLQIVGICLYVPTLCIAQVTSYEDSIYNYKNSPYNYDNSQYNYKNSPYNYDNSSLNPYAPNAVMDAQGNRAGYATTSPQGVTNYYDNQGVRKAYQVK